MSVRVTRVKRSSLSRIGTIRSVTRDDHGNIHEKSLDGLSLQNASDWRSMRIRPMPFERRTSSENPIYSSVLEMSQISSFHKNKSRNPRLFLPSCYSLHPTLKPWSFTKSIGSFDKPQSSINLFQFKSNVEHQGKDWRNINSIFENRSKKPGYHFQENQEKKERERRRRCPLCAFCPNCCCLGSAVGTLLFLAGIAALIIFLITNNHTTTTSFLTSTTTVTVTSITSITSATSTSISSATSTTSVTTITTISTSSTSSDTTTTTTPAPPCAPTSVGSNGSLYWESRTSSSQYQCFAYDWTSPITGLVTLAFQLRTDPSLWYVDDVSVYDGGTEMLINGDFETGSLSPWVRTTPNGACAGLAGHVSNVLPFSGNYSLVDGSNGCADQISQQFNATTGDTYIVSFWLKLLGAGSVQTVLVTLS